SSVSVMNLTVLSHLQDEPAWDARVQKTLRAFAGRLETIGRAVPMMAASFAAWSSGLQQIVIVGDGEIADAMFDVATSRYRPFAIVLQLSSNQQQRLSDVAPFVSAMHPVNGAPAAYICRDFSCRAPVTSAAALARELGDV